jgi:hypothetical protein
VKKNSEETTLFDTSKKNQNKSIEKIKTTNVNILLNRVRLDEKRIFKKRILFASIFIALLCALSAYLVI